MTTQTIHPRASELLETITDYLDIPKSYYQRASARHKSLGDWLCRPDSRLATYDPHVSPQGSFRYGTVIRPLHEGEEYDLDNVATLHMPKTAMSQRQLKALYGAEIISYAKANNILAPVEEKHRCWRLVYADEANFHLDTLPCLPEDAAHIARLLAHQVPQELAQRAIAITDDRHPLYEQITNDLLSSNPRGFARWFEDRARPAATTRLRKLVERRLYASVDAVPPYEWKTPLQRCIQLFKRHRDVMFRKTPDLAPISMIITNLAAQAYNGENDLPRALLEIVERMPQFVRPTSPRVPNPADPTEDYADKWRANPALEQHFWLWLTQLTSDAASLAALCAGRDVTREVRTMMSVELTEEDAQRFGGERRTSPIVYAAPAVAVTTPPRPWGNG
jgi:hypothetical protein